MYNRSFSDSERSFCIPVPVQPVNGLYVEKLVLTHFRNYKSLTLSFPEKTKQIVLTGKNGAGKTNIIEAVSLLTAGRGLREARLSDLAQQSAVLNAQWAVFAQIRHHTDLLNIGTGRTKGCTEKRLVRIDGEATSQAHLAHLLPMVWMTPVMDRLFSAQPAVRRRFLDRLAQCFDAHHAGHCIAYAKALKQWHFLMKNDSKDTRWFETLEKTLASFGEKISKTRTQTLLKLNTFLSNTGMNVFPKMSLSLENVPPSEQMESLFAFARNNQTFPVGIHQTDLQAVNIDKNMPAHLCSTGEQKAMVTAVLIAHLRAQAEKTGTLPLLLLDEASAHLDKTRFDAFLSELSRLNTQVWFTGVDETAFSLLKDTAFFHTVSSPLNTPSAFNAVAS